jgi:zinc protease
VTDAELQKAVKQFVSATLSSRKTMQGQAADLGGNWLAAGDLNFSQRYLAAVKRITPADLQRVAREYLTPENRTLYALLPEGTSPKTATLTETNTDHAIQKFTLPNGLKLLIKEDHRLPFVEFRAVFQGGVLAENKDNNGISQIISRLLVKGTKTRNAEQIATEIESVGGSLDSYGGNNSFGVNAEVLSSDFATGLGLVADVILNPTFPAAQLEREREVQMAGIRSNKDDLLKSAFKAMRRELFGAVSYGLDSLGTEETLSTLDSAKVTAFYRQLATPENCVLAIYGDVNTAETKAAVEKAFAHWKSASALEARPSTFTPRTSPKRVTDSRDKKQAVVVIGFPGTTISAPDRQAMELLQEACSDLGSRLFLRIREKLGLAYYVGAQNLLGLSPGYFAFYAGTEPDKAAQVEQEMFKEVELLRTDCLTEEELKRAKAKIIGQRKISRQELGGLATTTALDELYGFGFAHSDAEDAKIEATTLAQVKAVAQKYLQPETAVVSVINPGGH